MNNTVLITGANHGLGLSLVKIFLENDFIVFAGVYGLVDNSQINNLKNNDNLHIINLDITDTTTIKEAAHYIENLTGSIDIIINNAGIIPYDESQTTYKTIFDELDYDAIKNVIDVNAIGTLRVSNVFSHLLIKGNRKLLVNISSEAGSLNDCKRNSWFGYCMSKAALNMAGLVMHNELIKHGGQVMLIHPGYVQTYMHGYVNENATISPDFSAKNVFKQIQNSEQYKGEKAVYIDLFGNKMNW